MTSARPECHDAARLGTRSFDEQRVIGNGLNVKQAYFALLAAKACAGVRNDRTGREPSPSGSGVFQATKPRFDVTAPMEVNNAKLGMINFEQCATRTII
jgi:hypothetical protein